MTLSDLIRRLEGAEGPSRELDGDIFAEIEAWYPIPSPGILKWAKKAAPEYTKSLDEALTLVPRGHRWLLDKRPYADSRTDGYRCEVYRQGWPYKSDNSDKPQAWHRTPALALCAAALKARLAMMTDGKEGADRPKPLASEW